MEQHAEEQRIIRLIAWPLEFHRADRPVGWKHFEQLDAGELERYDPGCLADWSALKTPSQVIAQPVGREYRFDAHDESQMEVGDSGVIPPNEIMPTKGTIPTSVMTGGERELVTRFSSKHMVLRIQI